MQNHDPRDPRHPNREGGAIKKWLVRKSKQAAISVAIVVLLTLGVRAGIAEVFKGSSNAVAPEVPPNSRVLVYKLARSFKAGDIVVYRNSGAGGTAMLGRVVAVDPRAGQLTLARSGERDQSVALRQVVGRVVLSTR